MKSLKYQFECYPGSESMMQLLIENGANINAVNMYNNTGLILCISKGFDKAAEFLIRKGPDVNIVGQGGNTALTWAAFRGFHIFQI